MILSKVICGDPPLFPSRPFYLLLKNANQSHSRENVYVAFHKTILEVRNYLPTARHEKKNDKGPLKTSHQRREDVAAGWAIWPRRL